MEIRSGLGFPAGHLSNFYPHPFIMDGILCNSMEGWLQSLKFKNPAIQVEVCKLVGRAAKERGKKRNKAWQALQKLWWLGVEYDRHGPELQRLYDRAFAAYAKNPAVQRALLATGNSPLYHSMGNSNPRKTVLTPKEFTTRLEAIRAQLQQPKRNRPR